MFDEQYGAFKKHNEVAEENVDDMTKCIYKSAQETLRLVGSRVDALKPGQREYVKDLQVFCEGYEAGIIKHWDDFYMSAAAFTAYAAKKPVGWRPYQGVK